MTLENEYEAILDRAKHTQDYKDHFADAEILLKDIVNYGSNLIPRCLATSDRRLKDVIIIGAFLRQVVAMVDGAEIQISNSAVHTSQLQARACFEASICINWLIKSDTDKKAKYFYVSNLRREKLWAQRYLGESPRQAQFDEIVSELGENFINKSEEIELKARKIIKDIDELLTKESYKAINDHFQKYINTNNLPFEPTWHKVYGIKSVRQIAIDVERLPEYEFLYSITSEVMHSASYRHHFKFENDQLIFEPIRCLKDIKTIINFIIPCAVRTYMDVLTFYRPTEVPAFRTKYSEDWRDKFFGVKAVNYGEPLERKIL
jgi:hypothetical protein